MITENEATKSQHGRLYDGHGGEQETIHWTLSPVGTPQKLTSKYEEVAVRMDYQNPMSSRLHVVKDSDNTRLEKRSEIEV